MFLASIKSFTCRSLVLRKLWPFFTFSFINGPASRLQRTGNTNANFILRIVEVRYDSSVMGLHYLRILFTKKNICYQRPNNCKKIVTNFWTLLFDLNNNNVHLQMKYTYYVSCWDQAFKDQTKLENDNKEKSSKSNDIFLYLIVTMQFIAIFSFCVKANDNWQHYHSKRHNVDILSQHFWG